ncbi:MAG: glycosyltransferase family 4 protein [Anaerolinea sp.]|nr:glycosyltransferase family 4 protein [Anaerolinea sp.]
MRVALLAAAPFDKQGWGRYARDLIATLEAHGVAITLIASTDAPADSGLPVSAYHRLLPPLVPAPRFTTARHLWAIASVRQAASACDLIHVIAEPYALEAGFGAKPLVVTAHGTYLPLTARHPLLGWRYRHTYRRARILCVSSYTQKRVLESVPGAHTEVIPNGVDVSRFQTLPAPITKRGPLIVSVGQIKRRKGFHLLIRAMPSVHDLYPDAEAVIIGDTSADQDYVASLNAEIQRLNLQGVVRLTGRVSDEQLRAYYAAADIFALPALSSKTQFEGFGLVYLEASAAGLPVIGTRDCGAEDAIREGETGLLIPQDDSAALTAAIDSLLRDPDLRTRMGAAGKVFAASQTWDQVGDRVAAAYQTVIARKK